MDNDREIDRLIEMSSRLGSVESKADVATAAINAHTNECIQFRVRILSQIEQNRAAAEERHTGLLETLASVSRAQDKMLIRFGTAIIGVLISGFGALAVMWLQLYVTR